PRRDETRRNETTGAARIGAVRRVDILPTACAAYPPTTGCNAEFTYLLSTFWELSESSPRSLGIPHVQTSINLSPPRPGHFIDRRGRLRSVGHILGHPAARADAARARAATEAAI